MVLDQGQIDSPIAEMSGGVVTNLTFICSLEAEHPFIESTGCFQIRDLQRNVNNPRHGLAFPFGWNSGACVLDILLAAGSGTNQNQPTVGQDITQSEVNDFDGRSSSDFRPLRLNEF